MAAFSDALAVFAPEIEVLTLPPWDTVPYDRVSPNLDVVSQRMETLGRLASPREGKCPRIVVTTVSAVTQRLPRPETLSGAVFTIRQGTEVDLKALTGFLERNGYGRAEQVMEPGEYAVRGGIVDIFPSRFV